MPYSSLSGQIYSARRYSASRARGLANQIRINNLVGSSYGGLGSGFRSFSSFYSSYNPVASAGLRVPGLAGITGPSGISGIPGVAGWNRGFRAPSPIQGTLDRPYTKAQLGFAEAMMNPWIKPFTSGNPASILGEVSSFMNPQALGAKIGTRTLQGVQSYLTSPRTQTAGITAKGGTLEFERTQSRLAALTGSRLGQNTVTTQFRDASGKLNFVSKDITPSVLYNLTGGVLGTGYVHQAPTGAYQNQSMAIAALGLAGSGIQKLGQLITRPFISAPQPGVRVGGLGFIDSISQSIANHPKLIDFGASVIGGALGAADVPFSQQLGRLGASTLVGLYGAGEWGVTPRPTTVQGGQVYSTAAGGMGKQQTTTYQSPVAKMLSMMGINLPVPQSTSVLLNKPIPPKIPATQPRQTPPPSPVRVPWLQGGVVPAGGVPTTYSRGLNWASGQQLGGGQILGAINSLTGNFAPGVVGTAGARGVSSAIAAQNVAKSNLAQAAARLSTIGSNRAMAVHSGTTIPVHTGYKSADEFLATDRVTDPLRVGGGAPMSPQQRAIDAQQAANAAALARDPSLAQGWDKYNQTNYYNPDDNFVYGGSATLAGIRALAQAKSQAHKQRLQAMGLVPPPKAAGVSDGMIRAMREHAAARAYMLEGLTTRQISKKDSELLPWARSVPNVHKTLTNPDFKMSGPSQNVQTGRIRTSEGVFELEAQKKNKVFSTAKKAA